jgi:outer membrane murein-binding lipoprotein Lpp
MLPAAVAALTMLAGCGDKGPTSAKAGQTLNAEMKQLMDEIHATDVQVTNDAMADIACGDGKAKRSYAARARLSDQHSPIGVLNLTAGAITHVADYRVTDAGSATTPLRLQNKKTESNVTVQAPAGDQVVVTGETLCLRRD